MRTRMLFANEAQFRREMESSDQKRRSAAQISLRTEAYRLRSVLKDQIRAGSPGGQTFAPLSVIARSVRKGVEKKPLAKLAGRVRYWQNGSGFSIGFNSGAVVGMNGVTLKSNQLSRSWIRIARKQQEGFDLPLPPIAKSVLRHVGGKLKKRGWTGEARYYFLRRSTTKAHVPARNIVEPFWAQQRSLAARNIVNNFNRKLAGERI